MTLSTTHTARSTKSKRVGCASSYLVLSAYCLVLPLVTGCVYRSLTIKTEPPGALVYVNDQLKGNSPVTYDFEWYGWHRLTLRKTGYERLDDRKQLRSPIYLWIPFDLVAELLPFRISDTRTWSYTLTPAPALPTPAPPTELGYPPQVGERGSPGAAGGWPTEPPTSPNPQPAAAAPVAPQSTTEQSDAAR